MPAGSATHPHDGGVRSERCPACGKCNEVQIACQGSDDSSQEYKCAGCGQVLGSVPAAKPPRTTIVPDTRCGGS